MLVSLRVPARPTDSASRARPIPVNVPWHGLYAMQCHIHRLLGGLGWALGGCCGASESSGQPPTVWPFPASLLALFASAQRAAATETVRQQAAAGRPVRGPRM